LFPLIFIIKYANNKRAITIRSTTTTPAMSPALDVGLAAVDVVNAVYHHMKKIQL
jgi:hypothetical protein